MSGLLKNFQPNSLTFWFGFLTGVLTWWFIGRLRVLLPKAKQTVSERIRKARQELLSSTESRLRADVLRLAQRQHLASPLFALDEILVTPRLIVPSMICAPVGASTETDIHGLSLPYLPDRPELAARFHMPTLSLQQALEEGANLLLMGHPGSGKTVTLAALATWAARQSENLGSLRNHLPLYVQAADLGLAQGIPLDLLAPIQTAVSEYASPLSMPRLPATLRIAFESGKVLLLVDGLDEAIPEVVERVSEYLATLQIKYPKARIVATSSFEYYDGLVSSGLAPVALAAWDDRQKEQFIQHWGELWERFIQRPATEESAQPIDLLMLNGWLQHSEMTNTPLELTLRVWAAYAGDATGPSAADSIRAYIKRLVVGIPDGYQALQKIAVQMITQGLPIATVKEVEIWIADLLKKRALEAGDVQTMERLSVLLEKPAEDLVNPEKLASPAEVPAPEEENKGIVSRLRPKKETQTATAHLLPDLAASGLLYARKDGRLGFSHIVIAGYLASQGLAEGKLVDCLNDMPGWEGKYLAMRFLTAVDDLSLQINPLLEGKRDPLLHGLFLAGSWLADASKVVGWRASALKKLAAVIQNDSNSLGLRARALCTLAGTRDPGAGLLFRQLLSAQSDTIRLLAALGCGLSRDPKAVDELIQLVQDPCLQVGQAAILALSAIHTQPALEAVAAAILEGSEELRRTAAEALAYDPEEGHPVLTEGSQMEDLLVRRAVVYGLARVGQPWAEELLEKIQIEDGQWVVRSAATQALEEVRRPNPHTPRPLPVPTEIPWILEVAGQMGMGVTPGKPVTDLVVQALKAGDPQHCRTALDYLVQRPELAAVPQIWQILYGPEGDLREAAFNTLWHMYAAGMDLPSPKQFGLG